jgi:hypothetical protein
MVSAWCQHGVSMVSTGCQHGVDRVSAWCQHGGVNVASTCCQHVGDVSGAATWCRHGADHGVNTVLNMESTWSQRVPSPVSAWCQHGSTWRQHGGNMVATWRQQGVCTMSQAQHRASMESARCPYGVHRAINTASTQCQYSVREVYARSTHGVNVVTERGQQVFQPQHCDNINVASTWFQSHQLANRYTITPKTPIKDAPSLRTSLRRVP